MKKKVFNLALFSSVLSMTFMACKKYNPPPVATVVKEWNIPLSAKNENPAPAGRTETGTAALKLFSDNSLSYKINVTGLAAEDALTAAHIHVGNVITNGGVIQGFNPIFSGNTATGTLTNLRITLIDSLKSDMNELYFNVHSTQQPGGIVRGQLNVGIDMAADIALSGANEVPAVTTTATGLALLRVTADKKLYSRVTVTNLESTDALTAAHIHTGAAGVNGPVIIGLAANAADFGTIKIFTLTDALFATIKTAAVYVNAHSTTRPGGVVRGQIR